MSMSDDGYMTREEEEAKDEAMLAVLRKGKPEEMTGYEVFTVAKKSFTAEETWHVEVFLYNEDKGKSATLAFTSPNELTRFVRILKLAYQTVHDQGDKWPKR